MERVVSDGTAQLVSLCRPLIAEPNLVEKLRTGVQVHACCERCGQCRPKKPGEYLACRNEKVLERARARA
jgi:2,4-dienoyl-CoA reductase-like NADH-dependent reductase (Old Yellow Enzyme family)